MKKLLMLLYSLLFAISLFGQANFTTAVLTTDPDGTGWFKWYEEGLTQGQTVSYSFNVKQTTYWQCAVGQSGNWNYKGQPFAYTLGGVGNEMSVSVLKDSVYASIGFEPYDPGPPTIPASCQQGQTKVQTCVFYYNPSIIDSTNNVTVQIKGLFEVVTAFPKAPSC